MSPLEGRSFAAGGILLLAVSVIRFGVEQGQAAAPLVGERGDELSVLLAESREVQEEAERRSKPLAAAERLDPNRSGEEDLDRLPGIGPVVAEAWIRERVESGGFSAVGDLLRVPGIGPATLKKIEADLDFSAGIPPDLWRSSPKARGRGGGPDRSGGLVGAREVPPKRVDINRASVQELQALPGIGPVLAERIVRSRSEDGPFRVAADLLRVSGIGPAVFARLESQVSVGG